MSTYAAILVLLVSEVLKLNVIVIAERKIKEIDKSKRMKKDISCKLKEKNGGVSILKYVRIDFKTKAKRTKMAA